MRTQPIRCGFRAVLAAGIVCGIAVAVARADDLDYLPSDAIERN